MVLRVRNPKIMKYSRLLLFGLLLLRSTTFAQNGTFSGSVTDAKTGEPLTGATITLLETSLGATTDVNGSYTLKNVTPKSYNIRASYIGYSSLTKYDIVIRSEGNIDINFQLLESAEQLQDVVIVVNPFSKIEETPLSIQSLSQQEVAAYPGGNNDIAKVVQSLPGISGSVGGFRNDVIIRGGAPSENVYYLDGIEIPTINHFSTQGSAGGPVGLLNVSFFEGVTLTTSSFGSQYDNVLSGVLQFDQRNGNERQFQGNVRLGASESGVTLEGPLFKKENEKSNTSFIVSARRSYLQFLFDVIGLPILPDYWDYQYKAHHQINPYNELIFTGVGSIDDFKVNELDEFDAEQKAVQEQVPIIQQRTNALGLSWKKRFKDNSGFMQTSVSTNTLLNTFSQYADNLNKTGLYFRNDSKEQETKLRYVVTNFLGNWTTTYGTSIQFVNYTNNTSDLVSNFKYITNLDFLRYGVFAQASTKFAQNRLGVSFGVRADGNTFTDTGSEFYRTLSPRASLSYQLDTQGKWTWSTSVGRYYKLPAYTILGFKDLNDTFVNNNVRYIKCDHLISGVEHLLTESSRITVEGFVKFYDDYPVSIIDNVSLANKGGGFEVLGNEPVTSVGRGRTYGAEFLYQQKFNGKLYAIAAITFYKSEFTGTDRDNFIVSTWDNGQLISLTGGYKFKRNWEVSTRLRYLGRAPYAPVDETATLANYPAIIKDYSRLGEVRLDPFSQLDIRIDKKWNFKKFSFDVYIDIQNVLASTTPSEPSYGLNREDDGTVIEPQSLVVVNSDDSGSVIPSLGVVVNF